MAARTIDRLSDLPDSVLTHILSFLRPTKFSVRTSILSRRWRYLWTDVPVIEFFGENQDFVEMFMLRHRLQSIITFGLERCVSQIWDERNLLKWVTSAIDRNVQKLHLNYFDDGSLPSRRLFTCKTLVYLTFFSCDVFPMGGAVCLPRLKKISLLSVDLEADEALPHLLSGCPVLEELVMDSFTYLGSCIISSPTMKRLTLNFGESSNKFNKLEINTLALSYLVFDHRLPVHMESEPLTSLVEAYITLFEDDEQDNFLYSRLLLEFIDRLCNVKSLKLDLSFCPQILDSVLSVWTMKFHNLTELKLEAGDCRFLLKFLENADNLEVIIFRQYNFWDEENKEIEGCMELPPQVPTCVLSHLRIIKLVLFVGKECEFETISNLFMNAKVLERMEISYTQCLGSNEETNLLNKISLFQRGSAACEVMFALAGCIHRL